MVASSLIGLWLMFSPAVFGSQGAAAHSDQVVGALIITVSVIVMAEVIRAGRFLNVLLGGWIAISPFTMGTVSTGATWNGIVAGALLVLLSFPRGEVREQYGSWQKLIR